MSRRKLKSAAGGEIELIELDRLKELMTYERRARRQGYQRIAGIDEAGRGPLAGPVVAAACIIPDGIAVPGVNDSKLLTPEQRETLFGVITGHPDIHYAVGIVDHQVIDTINIFQATIQAMLEAVSKLIHQPDFLFVDGLKLPHPTIPCEKIIKGDQLSHSVAAASVIAKVTRDRIMRDYHQVYPQYGFDQHKGYSTDLHLEMIAKYGACPIHRLTFKPFYEEEDVSSDLQGTLF